MMEKEIMTLNEIAEFYGNWLGAADHMEGDVDDPVQVLQWTFSSGLCDDFAWALNKLTGWPTVKAVWMGQYRIHGGIREYEEHHFLVQGPDGRFLDASGWIEPADLSLHVGPNFRLKEIEAKPQWLGFEEAIQDGLLSEEEFNDHLFTAIRLLPYPPFNSEFNHDSIHDIISMPKS